MGKRGPAPPTDGEKALAGIALVLPDLGDCPEDAADDAKEMFARLKPILEEGKLAGETDREAFAMLCSEWWLWRKLDRACRDAPLTVDGKNGVRANPIFAMRNASRGAFWQMADKFNLTPACRARLRVEASEPMEGEQEERMFGPRE
jgi:P27 family predicted phage terminase small subunit